MAYVAEIQLAVKGAKQLKELSAAIKDTSNKVDRLNRDIKTLSEGGIPRTINNLTSIVGQAAAAFNKVALGTQEASDAARNYYEANKTLNNALRERVKLLNDIQRAERSTVLSNIKASKAAREASGFGAFSSSIDTPTQKSIRRNREKTALATAAAETATQVQKLTERQEEFTTRTDAAAQAAARQTAAFYRQARIAKEVAKLNAAAAPAQLLLAPAAPGAPAMGGGARRRITGPVERLGGTRTDDEAAATLRLAQATNTLVQTTNRIDPKYNRFLPSSELLNATGRGLQQLTTNQTAFNNTVASGIRFQEKYNQELERRQRLGIGITSNRRPGATNGVFGGQFPVDGPVNLQSPGRRAVGGIGKRLPGAVGAGVVGGAFPLLFGQGGGAALGGAIGGVAGGLAGSLLGPVGGFAGSLVGTVLGDIADKANKVKEVAADLGLAAKETEQLSAAFKAAGADADSFAAAILAIQGVGFTDQEQVEALKLVSKLTEDYKGKIDKITAAYANFAAKGKVGISDIYKFTAQGIPILDALEKKFGTNREGVLQLAKDGKISAQELSDALISIANGATTAAAKTQTPFELAWKKITSATENAIKAIGIVFGTLLSPIVFVATKITEIFAAAFDFIVRDGIATSAELSGIIADIANDLLYLTKLDVFKSVKEAARKQQAALLNLNKPPEKLPDVGGITIPGNLPAGGESGAKPPEDRTQKLKADFEAIYRIAASENEIRDALFEGQKIRAADAELAKTLGDIERDRLNALLEANYASEKELINQIAQVRVTDAKLKNEDRRRDIAQEIFEEELQMQEAVRSSVQVFTDMRKERELDLQYSKTYSRLLMEGVLPAEAERIANFEKIIAAKLKENEIETALVTAAIEKAKADKLSTDDLEKRLKLLGLIKTAITGEAAAGPGAGPTNRERLQTEADRVRGELNTLIDPINLITNAAAGIGDAFSNSFKGIIDGSLSAKEALAGFFQSVADQFLDMAAQIIAKMIQMAILNTVLGVLPGAGGLGGFGAAGAGFGGSNAFSSFDAGGGFAFGGGLNLLPGRANGGPVSGGQMYMVGERGPELFVPGRSGSIVPNDKMGGGESSIVVNVDAKGTSVQGNDQNGNQLGRVIAAAIQQELVKQKRPGGLLA